MYPVYKLLRAVNRQYPNNGFINYVDVREDIYDTEETKRLIDEDLRDLINEAIQEVYKDIAIDETYSFPTVPGQREYALPEDCDLRDIQEVTRTFVGIRGPLRPPFGPNQEPDTDPAPVWEYDVTFTCPVEAGTIDGGTEKVYTVNGGETVPEVPVVELNEGYTFIGWFDGVETVQVETIFSTPVTQNITYTAICSNKEPNGDDNDGGYGDSPLGGE